MNSTLTNIIKMQITFAYIFYDQTNASINDQMLLDTLLSFTILSTTTNKLADLTPCVNYTSAAVHQYNTTSVQQDISTSVHQYSSKSVHQYSSTAVQH